MKKQIFIFLICSLLAAPVFARQYRIVYEVVDPTVIIGAQWTPTEPDQAYFDTTETIDLHHINYYNIEWSGANPGEGIPSIIKKDQENIDEITARRDLVIAKQVKKLEMEQAFLDAENNATYTTGGNVTYDASRDHLLEIFSDVQMAMDNGETEIVIYDIDGDAHTVTFAQAKPVYQQLRADSDARRANLKSKLKIINDCIYDSGCTVSDIEQITW